MPAILADLEHRPGISHLEWREMGFSQS